MKNLIERLSTYINSSGLCSEGIDLFLEHMPENPVVCTSIFLTGGPFDPANAARKLTLQLLHRGTDAQSVVSHVDSLHALFNNTWNQLCPIKGRLTPISEPGMVTRDAQNYFVYSLNYLLTTTELLT